MGYAILACLVEENYLHNIRRTIKNFKLNIEDTKPKIMNNIKHLLTYNRTKLINKIFEDIKINLNKVKVNPLPKSCGNHYYRLGIDCDYYLYNFLMNQEQEYEIEGKSITDTKKIWLEAIKEELENIIEEI